MRCVVALAACALAATVSLAQTAYLSDTAQTMGALPEGLLSRRAFVLYAPEFGEAEREQAQQVFQSVGIDAVGYMPDDMVFANADATRATVRYLTQREISFLVWLHRRAGRVALSFLPFAEGLAEATLENPAWELSYARFDALLTELARQCAARRERQNFLINEFPEENFIPAVAGGKLANFFAVDLKTDRLAVPSLPSPLPDSVALASFFQASYPFKYGLVGASEKSDVLRDQGFLYRLGYVRASEKTLRTLLHTSTPAAPLTDTRQLYKFYVQQLYSGDTYLGTEWDADVRWEDALRKYIDALRKALGL